MEANDRGRVAVLADPAPPAPELGQLVRVRGRFWAVTDVLASARQADEAVQHLVELASVEDDGLDKTLSVIWEIEPGAHIRETATLPRPERGHFDDPERLDAFLDAVRWGAITSADSKALQAPFRSGITIEDYQLDPVVRALRMPRVNLLIADDVGLGKTIEAGLVLQELVLRHRARTVLIVCPASLTLKWQQEMAGRFGLDFGIVDSAMLRELRRSRGVAANPFRTFPRLIVSIDWLKRPRAMGLVRDVLPPDANRYPRRFDLLIVDEVHTCAPAGRGRYAHDSERTKAIRTLSPHFEHRLFLSATPHNGYTESFTALLELLDPQRFARGVKPDAAQLRRAIVRRLKSELRAELAPNADGSPRFAERVIVPIEVTYPQSERDAHALMQAYAASRRGQPGASRATADFVTLLLKKRMFSSPEAFARTLAQHRATLAGAHRVKAGDKAVQAAFDRLDDDTDSDADAEEATEAALAAAARNSEATTPAQADMLERLAVWAEDARGRPDAKTEALLDWVERTCTETDSTGQRWWNDERVIVFTEYRHTQVWLAQLLTARGLGGDRLAMLYGGMDAEARERIKAEFQAEVSLRPVRVLLATDAASEGIDLQRHCHRLVHVEIPFSPTRLEQRNGRIDRHGQPAAEVLIHHFVGAGWQHAAAGSLEDDLDFLARIARKVDTIRDDLGTHGPVLAQAIEAKMLGRPADVDAPPPPERSSRAAEALNRIERDLADEVVALRQALADSVNELGIDAESVRRVVATALDLAHQPPLVPAVLVRGDGDDEGVVATVYDVGALTRSWARAAADLVHPVTKQRRPVTFDHALAGDHDDVVLAHLGHRLVAQSMRLLRAEVWSTTGQTGLSRVTARRAEVAELVVVVHARLVLTGADGHRLHEEVIQAGGRVAAGRFARYGVGQVAAALASALPERAGARAEAEAVAVWPGIEGPLWDAVEARAKERTAGLRRVLAEREHDDVAAITAVMSELRRTITARLDELRTDTAVQLELALFDTDDRDQWERDVDALGRRLDAIPAEIERETAAIRQRYAEPRPRLFPAAVSFLVPVGPR